MDKVVAFHALLRRDFRSFLRKGFQYLFPGDEYVHNWHIDAIIYQLMEVRAGRNRRLIINTCPRSLKSTIVSVLYPAWLMGNDPTIRIICTSYADTLVRNFSRQTRRVMESAWYKATFPRTRIDKASEEEITTTLGGARYAASLSGAITGRGGNLIIIDDPISPDQANSDVEREKAINQFREKIYSRLDRKETGAIIVVMQRFREDDLSGFLLQTGSYQHLCLPAICPEDTSVPTGPDEAYFWRKGEALHPKFESLESLAETRKAEGEQAFTAQYLQNPRPREGNFFRSEHLVFVDYNTITEEQEYILQSWDTASKTGRGNDFSVCTTIYVLQGKYYVVHVHRGKWEFAQLLQQMQQMALDHSPHEVLIEEAGSGIGLLQEIQRIPQMAPYNFMGVKPTLGKRLRAERQTATFAAGRVIFPSDEYWVEPLVHELLAFPNGRNDDQVDSLVQGLERLQENWQYRAALRAMPISVGQNDAPWAQHDPY